MNVLVVACARATPHSPSKQADATPKHASAAAGPDFTRGSVDLEGMRTTVGTPAVVARIRPPVGSPPSRPPASAGQGLDSVAQLLGEARPFFTPVMMPLTMADCVWAPVFRSKSENELLPESPLSHQTGTRLAVVVSCE